MIKLKDLLFEGIREKKAVEFLSNMVKKSPFKGKVYLAGGYPRDELLGLDPKDIDLVIELPKGGIKFANWITKKLGIYKSGSNPVIFKKFGTAKFNFRGIKYKGYDLSDIDIESVMTRTEKYTKGSRKPEVASGTLKQDVERRDFTVNSLLRDLTTGEIHDLTGMGKADLKKGIVKTALNPDVIFKEDPLRMLRAIRFTTKYGWDLPLFMIRSLKKNASQIRNISAERVQDELNKMLVTQRPKQAVRLLQLTGITKYVMPELDLLIGLKQNKYHKWDTMKHTLEVLKGTPANLITRLAALFHDIGKHATKEIIKGEIHFYGHEKVSAKITGDIMRRLKYPNNIIKAVTTAVGAHMKLKQAGPKAEIITDKTLRRLKAKLGDHLEDSLDVMHADNIAHADDYNLPHQIGSIRDRLKDLDKGQGGKPILPINGNDLKKQFGLKPGPIFKKLLKAVEDAWYENPKIDKDDALDIVNQELKRLGVK